MLLNQATGETVFTPPQEYETIMRLLDNLVAYINRPEQALEQFDRSLAIDPAHRLNVYSCAPRDYLGWAYFPFSIPEDHYLHVYMARLRKKLEPDVSEPRYLKNIRGLGYRFDVEA